MQKLFLMTMLSLTLIACDSQDKPKNTPQSGEDYDNTGKNIRDRDSMVKTPLDQSESEADRTITQKIRQALMSDDSLSTNAKNIKIITINGVVTLRGPVANPQEKEVIARKVNGVQGIVRVDNQLEFTRINN
ncbi:MAG: BON domain-containing protein [Parachlamydiaceae bacterium]|nr:BON domain-containing protein [Parachlamydiaceae bacterium]